MLEIVIIDDHALVVRGLELLFGNQPDLSVAGCASDAYAGLDLIEARQPDVVTLDLAMPGSHGLDLLDTIRSLAPRTRIIVLTGLSDVALLRDVIGKAPHAVVQKQGEPCHLLEAIRTAPGAAPILCPEITALIQNAPCAQAVRAGHLSARECDIVRRLADGMTTRLVAQDLGISEHTVRKHRENILAKLGVKSTAQLIAYAIQRGYI